MLQAHPLHFVADLMTADTRSLYDGSLRVPVTVLASSGDPLLPLPDIEATTHRLAAPRVDLVVVDADCHLILNEALDVSVPAVLTAVDGYLDDAARSASGPAPDRDRR